MEGPKPYSFQPTFTPEEMADRRNSGHSPSSSSDESDADFPPDPPRDRMEGNWWCRCVHCTPLDSPLQCRCCHEVNLCLPLIEEDEVGCITLHKDFVKVCLEPAVLRATLIARGDARGHDWRNVPAVLPNDSYRYAAYRMFTYWVHSHLGKGVRKVIPACAVRRIRASFPAADGRYKGFRWGDDGEVLEVPEELAI